jgi:preprotein translocase subunit SecG
MTPAWMKWAIAILIGFGVIAVGFRYAAWLLTGFFILNCFVLIIVVLLQSGKAADLAGAFGGAGSQTAFGPRGAANVLSKATTWCAIMFMLCALALVLRTDKAVEQGGSILQKVSKPAPAPAPAVPQPNTHDALPPGQQPATQPPASQTPSSSQPAPATSQPAQQPASSQPGQSAPAQKPPASAQQPPATSQPAPTPTPTKKP